MATDLYAKPVSSYLNYLPAIFQESDFLGRFLLAFEQVLSYSSDPAQPGLEDTLDRIHTYFYPGAAADTAQAPDEFLPWLAGWVALSLRADWPSDVKRKFIREIVPLYQKRGTKAGLETMLNLYTGEKVTVREFDDPAHYFQVEITLSEPDPLILRRKQQIAMAMIDQEKPAHTFYALQIRIPTMRITNQGANRLQLGKNTILGTGTVQI